MNLCVRAFQWSRCACDAIFRCDKYEGSNTEGTFLSKYFAWSFAIHSPGKLYVQVIRWRKRERKNYNALKFYVCSICAHTCVWHFILFMWLETLVATRMAMPATRNACCWSACSCSTTCTIACNGSHDNRIREHHFANIQVRIIAIFPFTMRLIDTMNFLLAMICAGPYLQHQNRFKLPLPYWRIFMWY